MKILISALVMATLVSGQANAAETTVTGKPNVIDSTTIIVSGQKVRLDYITSLKPGFACRWKNRPLDCGVLATAGLKDLVAGATGITCKQNTSGNFTCTAGGYDLAYGLIHAGWAVPNANAPTRYLTKMNRAKQRKLGLWAAKNNQNKIVATTLTAN